MLLKSKLSPKGSSKIQHRQLAPNERNDITFKYYESWAIQLARLAGAQGQQVNDHPGALQKGYCDREAQRSVAKHPRKVMRYCAWSLRVFGSCERQVQSPFLD